MNSDKIKLEAWLAKHESGMVDMLKKLVATPSDNPAGDCLPISEVVADQLRLRGFEPQLDLVDEKDVQAAGMIRVQNIIADTVIGTGEGPVIALNSHGDVVPPGDGWTYDPYGGLIVEGKLYGRGAAVSKSDIAVYTYAVMALRESGVTASGKLALAITFDEETGGEVGPQRLLRKGLLEPDYALVAGFTYAAVTAHNGCLHLEVILKGSSAHAAIPHTGADALEAMTDVLNALYAYRKQLSKMVSNVNGIHSPTLVVGLIQGGINTNVVPDRCAIRIDRRIIPEENPVTAEKELIAVIAAALEEVPGIELQVRRVLLAHPFRELAGTELLIEALRSNWSGVIQEGELPVQGVPLYADARHFTEAGVPAVMFGAGPRTLEEANGHRADEHVMLSDMTKAVRIVAFTLYDLLSR
ncbi:ArgE/DapE family deacylase [Paenibacillus solisilvae]|uniref:Probable succinyl-diaminopimelate desuccinylase n=1 Tax=Paenibacillus solisilvae TaxID=2486751 RepID=A0ABW0VY85_9BACL